MIVFTMIGIEHDLSSHGLLSGAFTFFAVRFWPGYLITFWGLYLFYWHRSAWILLAIHLAAIGVGIATPVVIMTFTHIWRMAVGEGHGYESGDREAATRRLE